MREVKSSKTKKKCTIYDIAREANVSTTSVFKAIKGKGGISEETRRRILDIVERKGYKSNILAQTLARNPIKIGVVVEHYSPEFIGDVISGMNSGFSKLADFRVEPVYGRLETCRSKQRVLDDLRQMMELNVDGIIISPEIPYKEYEDVFKEIHRKNIPVATVVCDLPNCPRVMYIRQNAFVVGQLGAELLTLYNKNDKNALFIGNKDVTLHRRIVSGFTTWMKSVGKEPVAVYETQDDDNVAYYATERLLNNYPDIDGIFVGTSHSMGVCKKIIEAGLAEKVSLVCVDTFPELMELLKNGIIKATVFQSPFLLGELAVMKMYKYIISKEIPDEKEVVINPTIVLRSNLDSYKNWIEHFEY